MRVRKHNGKVYGADFTTAEREAVEKELGRMKAEAERKNAENLDYLVLYAVYAHYGEDIEGLHNFFIDFCKEHKALCDRYEMYGVGDNEWLAKKKLQEIGVDVAKWYEELKLDETEINA